MTQLTPTDARFLRIAYEEAKAGYDEGGCPIGSVLADGARLIAQGRTSASSRATRSPTVGWSACAGPVASGRTGG
jgi:tRNA(Arg) A34 adenosine deaminase TadA